jgi:DNA-binding PadR family transcriptional regulator
MDAARGYIRPSGPKARWEAKVALKHAVLGALTQRRGYGYELVQRLSERLGPAWQLSASTVYAALDQLEQEGLAQGYAAGGAEGSERRERGTVRRFVYEATDSGIEAFEGWLERPSLRVEPVRSELALKIAVARPGDVPALLAAIEQAGRLVDAARRECVEATTPAAGRRWEDATRALVGTAAIARFDAELGWLGAAREALTTPAARAEAGGASLLIPRPA